MYNTWLHDRDDIWSLVYIISISVIEAYFSFSRCFYQKGLEVHSRHKLAVFVSPEWTLTLELLAPLVIALTFHCVVMPTDVKVQSNWLTFTYYNFLGKVLWCIRVYDHEYVFLCEIHKATCIYTCVFVQKTYYMLI